LASDLAKLSKAKIPFDIVFDQGIETLGLLDYDDSVKKTEKVDKKTK
jgi:hypothetical protein